MKTIILTLALTLLAVTSFAVSKHPKFVEGKKYQVGDTVLFKKHVCVITKATYTTYEGYINVFTHYTLTKIN